jgi:hypothetical protein
MNFSLWNRPYMHWYVNSIDSHSPTCFSTSCDPISVVSFELVGNVRHNHSLTYMAQRYVCVWEWLWLTLRTSSKDTTVTDLRNSWWWYSRSTETCRRWYVCCVHISVHVRLVWWIEFCIMHCTYHIKVNERRSYHNICGAFTTHL